VWRAAKVVKKDRKLCQAGIVAEDEHRCHWINLKNGSQFRNLRDVKS